MRLDHIYLLEANRASETSLSTRVVRETELPFAGYSVASCSLTAKRREGVLPDIAWDDRLMRRGVADSCTPHRRTPGNTIIDDE